MKFEIQLNFFFIFSQHWFDTSSRAEAAKGIFFLKILKLNFPKRRHAYNDRINKCRLFKSRFFLIQTLDINLGDGVILLLYLQKDA